MLRPILTAAAVAATAAFSAPAQAQVQFEFGIDRPGYDGPRYHEPRGYRFAGERRGFRGPAVLDDDDDDCRLVTRRRVNRYGEVVERRMRICD
ncbi:hypothetical protein FG93_05064 [Bosea sp. LC85]|uniref:hypothetical protein n=1 Tax=Bosea sp. LC85 TaxID=1502851 RepID=UPI0004E3864D|nr:hypothetical protein [Bosea sp. LC85]KFC64774.1 hypothetical protein FG93_05064 [Bosea sp. LC85]